MHGRFRRIEYACLQGNVNVIKYLANRFFPGKDFVELSEYNHPLKAIVYSGKIPAVQWVIDQYDLNQGDISCVVENACQRKQMHIAVYLVEKYNMTYEDFEDFKKRNGDIIKAVKYLIEVGAFAELPADVSEESLINSNHGSIQWVINYFRTVKM